VFEMIDREIHRFPSRRGVGCSRKLL
jgi:hypothetical protein